MYYKHTGWLSIADWLDNSTYKNLRNIKYLSYKDTKKYILSEFPEIINKQAWSNLDKTRLPVYIPKRPDYVYKNQGWLNWESFLNSDLSPRSKSKLFLSYSKSKKYVQQLEFNNEYEYYAYIKENNILFLPLRPDSAYKKDWKGYIEFLGCISNRESFGERRIKEILEQENVEYEQEKKFTNCKNIRPLPFDFYLPELNLCIEYDGELHFIPSKLYGGQKALNRIKKHDSIKTKWCNENKIELLRITYLERKKIKKIIIDKLKKNEI